MSDRRTDVMALLSSIPIIVFALLLHYYARTTPGSSLLAFGYFLDALITTGVIGNLIVFVLLKTTKLNPLRAVIWVFGVVHAALLLLILLVFSRFDPGFNLGGVLLGYLFSFVFWVGLHWAWRARSRNQTAGAG